MFPIPLPSPLQHGTFVDDLTMGVVFIILVGVFFYFYFTGGDEPDGTEPGTDDAPE